MNNNFKTMTWAFLISVAQMAGVSLVRASDFPSKPIRIVVPYPPGGSNDLLARYFADKLTERIGEQMVVDNRGGANGIIGTQVAANAAPDGYTLLVVSTSFTMNAAVRKLPYDVEKSFDPIAIFGTSPNSIVVYPQWGPTTLDEIVSRAKSAPGSLMYASSGIGGFNHFGGELFKNLAGIDLVHVPYKGGGPAMIDVMGGQLPMMFSSLTQVLPHVRTEKLRLVVIGADKRNPVVPDVPTFIESGYPDYQVYVWWGVVVPHRVAQEVRDRLTHVFAEIIDDAGPKKRLAAEAAEPRSMTPQEFGRLIHDEVGKWRTVAASAGIQVF